MKPLLVTTIVASILFAAVLLGRVLRRFMPEEHFSTDSKDAVKLAMGLVATMTALLLGLLVSSAKSTYDTQRGQVIQLSAKVIFLDRVLSLYGPETMGIRRDLHAGIADMIRRVWPEAADGAADLKPEARRGDAVYVALEALTPSDESQRGLKTQAIALAVEIAQVRTLFVAQSVPSISMTVLAVLVCWLVVTFVSSSLLAPPNAMTAVALMAAVGSVAGAVFLILELDSPFAGILRISSQPMVTALQHVAQ